MFTCYTSNSQTVVGIAPISISIQKAKTEALLLAQNSCKSENAGWQNNAPMMYVFTKAWFPISQLRPRQQPILCQNKAVTGMDDCSTTRFVFCVLVMGFVVNGNQAK